MGYETELIDMEASWIGHLLVYDVQTFHDRLASIEMVSRDEIHSIVNLLDICPSAPCKLSVAEYRHLYDTHQDMAFQWQYEIPDEMLGKLLPLFRKWAKVYVQT